jgi:hypothetical protein
MEIEFDATDPEYGSIGCNLRDVEEIKAGKVKMVDSDEYITPLQTLTAVIDYPLTNAVTVTFKTKNVKGFTRKSFFLQVVKAYQRIYKEEGPDPEAPASAALYNRPTTQGKYGIWGHGIEDLCLEYADISKKGVVKLFIGS